MVGKRAISILRLRLLRRFHFIGVCFLNTHTHTCTICCGAGAEGDRLREKARAAALAAGIKRVQDADLKVAALAVLVVAPVV
jgi:hypothetical protein